jgi:hypothetical protein
MEQADVALWQHGLYQAAHDVRVDVLGVVLYQEACSLASTACGSHVVVCSRGSLFLDVHCTSFSVSL